MARCLSRATLITVRLDMKAAMQGTVSTNLNINIDKLCSSKSQTAKRKSQRQFYNRLVFIFRRKLICKKFLVSIENVFYIYRQCISYSEKEKVLLSLTLMVKGRESASMRSENARLKIKIFRADLILSLITAISTRALLTTKMIQSVLKKD